MKKTLYKNKKTGDIFALEFDDDGNLLRTSGPLLSKDLNPEHLDYDDYFKSEIQVKIKDFELLSKAEYMALLEKYGFYSPPVQRYLFDCSQKLEPREKRM